MNLLQRLIPRSATNRRKKAKESAAFIDTMQNRKRRKEIREDTQTSTSLNLGGCSKTKMALAVALFLVANFALYLYLPDDETDFERALGVEFEMTPGSVYFGREVKSALKRATTSECKRKIAWTAFKIYKDSLIPRRLPNSCPSSQNPEIKGQYLGCYRDSFERRLLGKMKKFHGTNSVDTCISFCHNEGYALAGLQYGEECMCGNDNRLSEDQKLEETKCDEMPCTGDAKQSCGGYLAMNVYKTGLLVQTAEIRPSPEELRNSLAEDPVRVVYLLTLNGRAVRQVRRLIKRLYDGRSYFFIHVDSRQEYMFREMKALEAKFPANIKVTDERRATIWGGTSLLDMLVDCFRQIEEIVEWRWDYVLNLSESDYPIKPSSSLIRYLSGLRGKNFVKSNGAETATFVRKQGLEKAFVECDRHLWKVGNKQIPEGLIVDGGSDWVCLHKDFIHFVLNPDDAVSLELITGLKTVFSHSLLPAEAFFHMALKNSRFCTDVVNNNLHFTNWRRKQGCKCQHKAVVDWCGCSPNDLTMPGDWNKLNNTASKELFFARKFEAAVDQEIVNAVDRWIDGYLDANEESLNWYWQNIFHADIEGNDAKNQNSPMIRMAERISKSVFEDSESGTSLPFILEINGVWKNNVPYGILILCSKSEIIKEVLVEPPQYRGAVSIAGRTLNVQIGSQFDPKELLFRDVYNLLTWQSEISLSFEVTEGQDNLNTTFVLFDAKGRVVWNQSLEIEEADFAVDSVIVHKATDQSLDSQFSSGLWTLIVVFNDMEDPRVLTRFPVVLKDADLLHSLDADNYNAKVHNNPGPFQNMFQNVNQHFLHPKKSLKHFIAENLYLILDSCNLHGEECKKKTWSSKSPDPKSEIGVFNVEAGKLEA